MNKTEVVFFLLCFLAAAAIVWRERRKSRKTMEQIEKMLDAPVFLKLWVKVKNDWRNNAYFLSELSVMQEQDLT